MVRWFIDRFPRPNTPSSTLRRVSSEAAFVGDPDRRFADSATGSGRDEPRLAILTGTLPAHDGLSRTWASPPAARPDVVGVAGGSEATTTALLLRSIFDRAGERLGVVGLEIPGGPDGFEGVGLAAAVVVGVRRASGEDRSVLDARRRAYAKLARLVVAGGTVVVDEEDPDSEILGAVNLGAGRVSIGVERPADVRGEVVSADRRGARFRMTGLGMDETATLGLGLGSIRSALAAAAVARARGVDGSAIVEGLEAASRLAG